MPFILPKFKTAKKTCEFEGCTEVFMGVSSGINPSKYCEEHRKQKYKKGVEKIKVKHPIKESISSNQIIKHSFKIATVIVGKCQLEGCGKDFEILVVPNTHIYPKYCEEHRNEFKRERFVEQHG